ncbi:hypothetical protein Bca52824_001958 [Brassica carinata]|uniref:Uncharacterized protein n=1 Tax=Brassica carinata TaxID=52824 RepID=A0A8X7WMI9_BRACI|nr:hypothetical protein Bca52824_001958 [Brassica carinata]
MATTTITNRVSPTFLAPTNSNRSILRKPASVCFSNLGSSIVPRLAVATSSSFKNHLSADGLPRSAGRNLGCVRASSRDEEDEKRATATWHYQLFSVLKLLIVAKPVCGS